MHEHKPKSHSSPRPPQTTPPAGGETSVPRLGGFTRRGEDPTSPLVRSRPALQGKDAAQVAAHTAQLFTWGRGGSNPEAHKPEGGGGTGPGDPDP